MWSTKSKTFTDGTFTRRACQPLPYTTRCQRYPPITISKLQELGAASVPWSLESSPAKRNAGSLAIPYQSQSCKEHEISTAYYQQPAIPTVFTTRACQP